MRYGQWHDGQGAVEHAWRWGATWFLRIGHEEVQLQRIRLRAPEEQRDAFHRLLGQALRHHQAHRGERFAFLEGEPVGEFETGESS